MANLSSDRTQTALSGGVGAMKSSDVSATCVSAIPFLAVALFAEGAAYAGLPDATGVLIYFSIAKAILSLP